MSNHRHRPDGEGQDRGQRANLVDLYEKMSKILRDNLERAGMLTEEAFERALNESREWAYKLKENYGNDIGKVAEFIRRDWHEAIRFTRERTRQSLDLDRLQAGLLDLLSRLAKSAGSQLESFASKLQERLTYKTGEIAGAGTLECTVCGQELFFDKPTRIPPCPKCHGTDFTRRY